MSVKFRVVVVQDCEAYEGCSPAEIYQLLDEQFTEKTKSAYWGRYCENKDSRKQRAKQCQRVYEPRSWVGYLLSYKVIAPIPEADVVEVRSDGP